MAKKDKYPSVMYIPLDGSNTDYYEAGPDFVCMAVMGEKRTLGVYKLSEIIEVEGHAKVVRR